LIARAQRALAVRVAPMHLPAVAGALAQARERGCRVVQPPLEPREDAATVLLVIDDREALVGTLAPADRAQAVAGANPGFVAVLARYFAPQQVFTAIHTSEPTVTTRETPPLAWLDWEQRKQRGLLNVRRLES
jgi:hypothetical protein